MQGNRDGSWFSSAIGDGRSGSSGSSGFRPLAPPPSLSSFGVQQQSNIYPVFQYPASFHQPNGGHFSGFSFAGPNFQGQQNLRIPLQIPTFPPQQFVGGNVFHQSHGQRLSFPPQPPLNFVGNDLGSGSQNHGGNGNSSLKRRHQKEVKRTDAAVNEAHEATAAVGETTHSVRVSQPLSNDVVNDEGSGSQVWGRKGSSEKSFSRSKRKGEVKRLDNAVSEARKAMIAAGENVSSARVSQSVLLEFQADSWRSLGVQMQDIPSLRQLMSVEGKINAFIHCFVGARRIVTLHDLEVAICRSEFVECFDDLDLGPLLQHPLIVLYFPSLSGATTPVEISSEDTLSFLDKFLDIHEQDPIKLDEFLNFVAKKKSVTNKESLGVRIQSLGMFVSFIRDAKRQEGETLKVLLTELHQKYRVLSSKKQQNDNKSLTIAERLESFSFGHKEFRGKHIRFDSSSSDEGYETPYIVKADSICDHFSSCPYPSVAEEMKRLGHTNRKRKAETLTGTDSSKSGRRHPSKYRRGLVKQEVHKSADDCDNEDIDNVHESDFTLSDPALKSFISTWKDTCKELNMDQAVEKMFQFYKFGGIETQSQRKSTKVMSSFPYVGLLNVAVTSMRRGMWDSIYDNLQKLCQDDMTYLDTEKEINDAPSNEQHESDNSQHIVPKRQSVTVEEIIRRISSYFDCGISGITHIDISRRLHDCGPLLAEHFQVPDFESLGWGGFFTFLAQHLSLLPTRLQMFLTRVFCEDSPLKVEMHEDLLTILLSQVSEFSGGNAVSKQMFSGFLAQQFPSINLKVVEKDPMENLTSVGSHKNNIVPKCILFSTILLGADSLICEGNHLEEISVVKNDSESRICPLGSVTSKDALDVLLTAPLLSDLNSWSHWDLRFASSLGPLLRWLSETNPKELLCVVTRDGKVVRIDPSATMDSFLEAALQGSAQRTAAQLLSLVSLNGGKYLPLSLLKSYAKRSFEVILNNHFEEMELYDSRSSFLHTHGTVKLSDASNILQLEKQRTKMDKSNYVASKFLLECLGYLPAEFRGLASDVLLSGLQSVVKDAPVKVLSACDQIEQRIMLHDVGLLRGIAEWINDYHCFCSPDSSSSEIKNASSNQDSCTNSVRKDSGELFRTEQQSTILSDKSVEPHSGTDSMEPCDDSVSKAVIQTVPEIYDYPASVIDLIRREEFGLDSSSSGDENVILQKQHARLGRALQCLSQELYSQDSHFILELVQNADDNRYPEHVEPTLAFFLQTNGIVVLNNECGFTSENIRALCDVGRSTKKGSSGYIGNKGIGFKSVFRVSDAPEIHSNGFHIKFDISEGQIGYILPTPVPPYDIESVNRMLSGHAQLNDTRWNTCIALPFKSAITERSLANQVEPMFSDLHPSLLLFLHHLKRIVYGNMLEDSFLVMRKEVVSENIIKVLCKENRMTWFVESAKLDAAALRVDVQKTEIAIAFRLNELEDGTYTSCVIQEPIFAFLPLRRYGLKFILQGDFILTSSREDVDGDSPWNQWLLSEVPGLFVNALRSFSSLPSFKGNLGKAVSTYMQLVPLAGEVHGFFSCLPRTIISKLRTTYCLLLEGDDDHWVPPCYALRGWNENARVLLKDGLLHEHLGVGFLHKDIILSDSLSRALGVEEYGPKVLVQILSSISHKKDGVRSMGLTWLSSFLTELYALLFHSPLRNIELGVDRDLIDSLRKIPFIPLSNGTFTSLDEGAIWLHHDTTGSDGDGFETFPMLYANLRTVDHTLLSASGGNSSPGDNLVKMLSTVGVQKLSAHEIVKAHILPGFEERSRDTAELLMVDYVCFAMTHLQSGCHLCHNERKYIISELRNKAVILTNSGLKRLTEVSIHFGEEFGNQVNMKRLTKNIDVLWHEVDGTYLKHPVSKSHACGLKTWREFFLEIGITDFVQVVSVEKSIAGLFSTSNGAMEDANSSSSPELSVRDWESPELVDLLSLLQKSEDREGCKYLLEALDTLWDDCYHDKTNVDCNVVPSGLINSSKSSFMKIICDTQWVVSSMDSRFHRPGDLFLDCDEVRSILGMSAPYSVPKVTSIKLLNDIGIKTKICLDDALEILEAWVQYGESFETSISQITKFYKFVWDQMPDSKQRIMKKFHDLPSVFVPRETGSSRRNDVISGMFLSIEDVYWRDSTGIFDQIEQMDSQISDVVDSFYRKTLSNIYPGLREFFVNGCGVPEIPSFKEYLRILEQLAHNVSPSCAAKAVFKLFLMWSDDLKSEKISEEVRLMREKLLQLEFTVLPTENNMWVSLHSSFGLVCWCDDEKLKKRFKNKENIQFIYFGELCEEEREMMRTKVSALMDSLGIPSISKVVKREAEYEGRQKNSQTVSLVNWAMSYAQRYMYTLHLEKYLQTKKTAFDQVKHLKVFVVQKLRYRNAIPEYGITSKKEFKCSCLLQDNVLYTTPDLDSHSLFLELSRLFFDGTPDLYMANFLHMIKTMVESGLNEEQTESFVLNSQKIQEIPEDEPVWFLKSAHKAMKKSGKTSWLPANRKTGQGSRGTCVEDNKESVSKQPNNNTQGENLSDVAEEHTPTEITDSNVTDGNNNCSKPTLQVSPNLLHPGPRTLAAPLNPNLFQESNNFSSSDFNERDQPQTGMAWAAQAIQTGRLGESIAYRYYTEKLGSEAMVTWVNEHSETGLPYDIVVEGGGKKEYIEVKATVSARKDWFNLSVWEWQFGCDKGDSYIVAHVLVGNANALLTQHRNPVKLCQEGKLRLVMLMPKQRNEVSLPIS